MEAARQAAWEYQRNIESLESRLEGSVSASEMEGLRSELEELRKRQDNLNGTRCIVQQTQSLDGQRTYLFHQDDYLYIRRQRAKTGLKGILHSPTVLF